jgi:excisionase family DNA binding protein
VKDDRLITVHELMERTSLGRSSVWALLARGEIPSVSIGRSRRVRLSDFLSWIEQLQREEPAPDLNSETGREAGPRATQHSG